MKEVLMVNNVKKYSFQADNGLIEGVNITCLGDEVNTSDEKGVTIIVLKSNDVNLYHAFGQVPGRYEIDFTMIPTSKGAKFVPKSAKLLDK
jgi:hypothetical protein